MGSEVRIMGSNVFMRNPIRFTGRTGFVILAGFTAALGGCSADVARFDFGHNALNDRTQTASIPTPSEPMRTRSNLLGADSPSSSSAPQATGQYSEGGAYMPPASNRASAPVRSQGVQVAALPDVSAPTPPAQSAAASDAPRANYVPAARRV